MDFFNFENIKKPSFDIQHAREFANSVANNYISSQVNPNESICKLAAAEGFTPEQIKVVATETNKAIHGALHKTASEKYHAADFPLADVSKILDKLQIHDGQDKLAAQFVDPILEKDYGPSAEDMFGVKVQELDKTASVKHQVKAASQKTNLLLGKIQDSLSMTNLHLDNAEKAFMKEARQMILQESLTELDRFKTLGSCFHFAKIAGFEDVSKETFAKLAYVLGKEGLIEPSRAKAAMSYFMDKTADQKAPEHLISKNLTGVEICNGQHPLYITLNTIEVHKRRKCGLENRFKIVQDTLEGLSQRIRAL